MENTITETPHKQKKVRKINITKEIIDERPRLPRTNRTIKCAYCGTEKILNPDQYQALYDYWGSEDKISREFMCKDCEMDAKHNPFKFWAKYGEAFQTLSRKIRAAFEVFNSSLKNNEDIIALQNMINSFLNENYIDIKNVEYGTEPAPNNKFTVKTLKLKTIPFIGTLTIQPYETTNNRLNFE